MLSRNTTSSSLVGEGRYALYDTIARGGMGAVHYGRLIGPVGFSRVVAIKCVRPDVDAAPLRAQLAAEARLASRVRHPNVVSIIDVVTHEGALFLVMEYVAGRTVAELVDLRRARRRVPPPIALAIAADVLHGLHAAHVASDEEGRPLGLVHHDVSPQNILVGADGMARLLDFGIAKVTARARIVPRDIVEGKPPYLSPEQLRQEPVDARTDLFALSIVLWEMLTGAALFGGATMTETMANVLMSPIPSPRSRGVDLAPGIEMLLERGLARRPDERFPSAEAMALAIEGAATLPRPSAVGAWLRTTAPSTLGAREAYVRAIERETLAEHAPVAEAPRARLARLGRRVVLAASSLAALVSIPVALDAISARAPGDSHAAAVESAPPATAPPPSPEATVLAVATAPPRTRRPPRPDDCGQPYFFDENGIKRFKPSCVR